ncbi:MAG: hypothetical protein AAGL69_09590 [Pseudomonadota bacterium]
MKDNQTGPKPWYRFPMVWLVVAIPALTVLGCIVTISIALSHPDPIIGKTLRQAQAEVSE